MKIIHTGDWHIGKIVNEFSMIEDQKYILEQLLEVIKREKPDALVIAGDIYDRSIPPVEAVELLNSIFKEILIDNGVKIAAIAGNHDSGERVSFGNEILEKQGLFIAGVLEDEVKRISFKNKNTDIYLIPYIDPAVIRKKYENPNIKNHNDAMKFMISGLEEKIDKTKINIVVAHGYVTVKREEALEDCNEDKYEAADIEVSDSERPLSIGGTDLIDGSIFKDFDYVALGHLHGRQKVGRESMRYSGSLLKYSFSEVNHKKGITIVNWNEEGDISIKQEQLIPMRDMRIIKGPIDKLIEVAKKEECNTSDYIQAILTDEGELIDPIGKLRTVYPNIMLLKRETNKNILESNTKAAEGYKSKSELELFKEYYERLGSGKFTKEKEEMIKIAVEDALRKENK